MTDRKRTRKTDAEKAREELGVAERALARLTGTRDALIDRLGTVELDMRRMTSRVQYLAADPALEAPGDADKLADKLDKHLNVAAPAKESKPIDVTGLTVLQDPLDPFAAF